MAIFGNKNEAIPQGEAFSLEDKKPVFPCVEITEYIKDVKNPFTAYGYNLSYTTENENDTNLFIQKRVYKNGQTFIDLALLNDETKEFKYVTVKNLNPITQPDGTKFVEIEYYPDFKDMTKTAKSYLPYKFTPTAENPVDHLSVELNKFQNNLPIEPSNVYKDKLEYGRIKPTVFPVIEQEKKSQPVNQTAVNQTTEKTAETEKPKGKVLGEQSKVSFNGHTGIEAPHIDQNDNSISMNIGISGGHFENGASQKITLTDQTISDDQLGRTLLSIYKQNPEKPSENIVFASVTKNGTAYQLHIDDTSLQTCLKNYELRTGKKFPLTGNIFNPQTIKMSDSNELQGAEINIGDGKTVSISFDAAGMKIESSEKMFNEDGSPILDEKGKQKTHEEVAFLSAGTRPLDVSVNPQFLHEASTVNPVVDDEGILIDPPLPSVKMEGRIAENIMVLSILQERQKAEKADENNKNVVISRTFGANKEIQVNSVPVYEEGLAEPYYLTVIRDKDAKPCIFLDMRAPKQGTKIGADLAPKFYEITEIGIEAKSVESAKNAGEKGKAEGFGLYLGIKSDNNKVRLNIPNLAYESFAKNGIIDFLDNVHVGADGYGGFPFNQLKSEIIGYRQKGTGEYFSVLPNPLPAGTTVKDFMEIHSRGKTNTNTIKGTNTIANLRNNINDYVEEEVQEAKDYIYQPKISYDTRKGQKLEFDKNGTTSISLTMDEKFGFEKDAAQKITLINDKDVNAGVNKTAPANPSEEKIISVTDPKLGGETISFTRTVKNGNTTYSMDFDVNLLQQMIADYKTTNNQDFDLDLSKLTAEEGKVKFDVDKILISDDLKIQGVEIKAAGKTLAIDITGAGYMISNGRQIARQRMDKQPLDFTFNSSILNDAENNENLNLKDGKIKDELQVMAIQQARFKAGFSAKNEPVILKYNENLTLYSLPVKVGDSIQNFVFRQEKGKVPELYADLDSPKGAAKLAPKFSKITHLNMEAMFDEAGKVLSTGLYLGERKNQNNSESIRVEVGNVDLTDETSQNLISAFEEMKENSKGNFHLNEFISSTDKQQIAVQGYRQIDTDPVTGEKTIQIVKNVQEGDEDPEHPKTAGREYQPLYSIGGEKSYQINWDNVAKLKNDSQKEIIEKEQPPEKKEPEYEMPKLPKRKEKTVNEYISSLGLIGVGMLAMLLGIIVPFFLIVTGVCFAAVVLKDSGLLAAVVKAFGPRDRDALDVHNDIVKTRSKIVEKDRQIKDFDAKMEEILKRAGNVNEKSGKINCDKLLGLNGNSVNIVDANGKPVDLKDITFDANGNPIDKNGNPLQIKDKCGFTQKQIQDIVKLQQDLIAKQEEINLQKNAKQQKKLREEAEELESQQRKVFDQDYNNFKELKRRKKQREKQLKKLRNKASNIIQEGTTLYNNGTAYDLDLRNEYTDEKGNLHSGTESFYNHNNRPEYDAAEMTNKNYKGDASKVEVKSEGRAR